MNKLIALTLVPISLLFTGSALAAVIQTSGAGSAVTTTDGIADFETIASLFDNPYSEGGMLFSRTYLDFNNANCGFNGSNGCQPHFSNQGFVGNFMYGAGYGGFFEIAADGGNIFTGLEFTAGSGFDNNNIRWEAYNNSILVGNGFLSLSGGGIIGFADAAGFDLLKFTSANDNSVDFSGTLNAPAFDAVRAQFGTHQVPEPMTFSLLGLGLAGWGFSRLRPKA